MMNWDDTIQNESQFILLPNGIYDFTVTKFEKGWHEGSAKLDPCPKAELELTIEAPQGRTTVKENLFLDQSVEWKLCAFFKSIGQKKHGVAFKMDWSKVLGAKGRAEIEVNEYQGNDGNMKKNNKVKMFIDEPEAPEPPQDTEIDDVMNEVLPW